MIMEKGITFPTKGSCGLMEESRTHNRKVASSSLGPAGIVGGGSECPALSTPSIPRLRCLWAVHTHSSEHTHTEPQTAPRVPQHKWLPTAPGVCSRCVCVHGVCSLLCVCTLDGLMQSMSMGYHTWLYVTSLSLSFPTRACGVRPITMHWVSWPIRADCACRKEGLCRKRSVWERRGIEELQ